MSTAQLVNNLNNVIINPLLTLMFAVGLLVFIWGLVEFMLGLSANSDKKEAGKSHMLWGIVGMFIMVAAWAILKLIDSTIGSNVVQ